MKIKSTFFINVKEISIFPPIYALDRVSRYEYLRKNNNNSNRTYTLSKNHQPREKEILFNRARLHRNG